LTARKKLRILGVIIALVILVPAMTQLGAGKTSKIGVSQGSEGTIVQTEYLTLKILNNGPHFVWWLGNRSSADEVYEVHFYAIQEFYGDDEILDDFSELTGLTYIFKGSQWAIAIVEGEALVQITLTLAGLSNEAQIQFIITIYEEDHTINDSEIKGLSEVKIDIVVENWHFSNNARGYAIQSIVSGTQEKQHRVRIRNGTTIEHGENHCSMQFESMERRNKRVAYYKWSTTADVYNGTDLLETIEVGNLYSTDVARVPGSDPPTIPSVFLAYPNYGDGLKMVHDPSIGIYPNSLPIPLSTTTIIGSLVFIAVVAAIIRKRK